VVRGNPELRGRVQAVDLEFWTEQELCEIGRLGFPLLNLDVAPAFIASLAREACGSPQIMQTLCLQLCFRHDVHEKLETQRAVAYDQSDLRKVLEIASTMADFSTLVEKMHDGPKERGQDRNQYRFKDDSTGDVYRCALLAMAESPPRMSLPYGELMERVQSVCRDKAPSGSSVTAACTQIDRIAGQLAGLQDGRELQRALEWDRSSEVETLHIADPYFLFYLRASRKLTSLGKAAEKEGTARLL
jgi:hypothetical protein